MRRLLYVSTRWVSSSPVSHHGATIRLAADLGPSRRSGRARGHGSRGPLNLDRGRSGRAAGCGSMSPLSLPGHLRRWAIHLLALLDEGSELVTMDEVGQSRGVFLAEVE